MQRRVLNEAAGLRSLKPRAVPVELDTSTVMLTGDPHDKTVRRQSRLSLPSVEEVNLAMVPSINAEAKDFELEQEIPSSLSVPI